MTAHLFHPLTELSRQLWQGETSSLALIDAYLARIDSCDAALHAFVEVYRDDARRMAQACDLERQAGLARGPLHGIPIAVKDLFEIAGRQTTAGAKSWRGRISDRTATCVERLLAAGMIPLGKTHMVEFAFGTWGTNAPCGAPRNPWDARTHRVAGGSSSGSAVAVAAGMAPAALGSDTGGSVRIPAALCGLTGLKLTYGLVSLHGVVPLSPTLDSVGPIARSVDDAVMLAGAMSGADPRDPATLPTPRFDARTWLANESDIRGMRVAAPASEHLPPNVSVDVLHARSEVIRVLRERGALVEEVEAPFDFADLGARNGKLIAAEAYALHRAYIEDPSREFDPGVRRRIVGGKATSAADYIEALAERRAMAARFAEWMAGRAALLTPSVPFPAVALADVDEGIAPMATFTRAINYLCGCALTVPAGMSSQGLPIGIQLAGAPFRESGLIAIGRAFQQVTDWHLRTPPLS